MESDRSILLALSSKTCCVPPHSTFEAARSRPRKIELRGSSSTCWFREHTIYEVNADPACAANKHLAGTTHAIHRFSLHANTAHNMNHALKQIALNRERSGTGVSRSNSGGWQSKADLFLEDAEDTDKAGDSSVERRVTRMLHEIASAGLDASRAVATATATDEAALPAKHDAYAWININRVQDWNLMHVHDLSKMSGVYFVAAGGVKAADSPAGHLVFRGGRATRDASHTYLALPPEPGTLYLFPGCLPHCVLPFGSAAAGALSSVKAASPPRISVAINFTGETKPTNLCNGAQARAPEVPELEPFLPKLLAQFSVRGSESCDRV